VLAPQPIHNPVNSANNLFGVLLSGIQEPVDRQLTRKKQLPVLSINDIELRGFPDNLQGMGIFLVNLQDLLQLSDRMYPTDAMLPIRQISLESITTFPMSETIRA
jgi:hypothetical protein